jgi:hypothetical protein
MRNHLRHIITERFSDYSKHSQNWIDLKQQELEKDQELKKELFDLIDKSYSYIGGHVNIKDPADIPADYTIWVSRDVDGDDEPDVVKFAKYTPFGIKWAGSATDGTREAKTELVQKTVNLLFQKGNYAEVSGAIAHILLKKFGVPEVNDPELVRDILGKEVEWVGKHPEGLYPEYSGWYYRKFGDGHKHMKILVGN